jgi:hypothetical protein
MMDLDAVGIVANPYGAAEQRVPCPHCAKGRRDRALGVNIASGIFHCFRCGLSGRAGGVDAIRRIDDPAVAERKRERLRRVWRESLPLCHAKARAVRAYLESRALGEVLLSPPPPLRAHPGLNFWDGSRDLGKYPAMIALFNGAAGAPVTLHVTYLRPDGRGKAPVPAPKKILGVPVKGATRGGSIRLYGPRDGVLGVAEGIESALSLHLLKKIPVWASFCADNLARIELPAGIRHVYIGMDLDPSGLGEGAALKLASRLAQRGRRPQIHIVKPEGAAPCDLNDELRRSS